MKMIVTWLVGVPVAVAFFFTVFAVDASKLSSVAPTQTKQAVEIAPGAAIASSEKWQSKAGLN